MAAHLTRVEKCYVKRGLSFVEKILFAAR